MTKPDKKQKPVSVVTGGAGFLGSHLTDLLLSRGHRVVAMDNLITGSVDNIAHLAGNPDFRFIQQDVTEFLFLEGPVDYVWHFASPASPIDYLEIPIQTLKVGSLGTHKALGLAKNKGARFLLASTSEIYGDPLVHPQTEEYWGNVNTIGPRGCYDESKRFAEALVMAYHREHKLETRIVRIFNTYGPRMRLNDGRVVPAFISQALEGKAITMFGDGSQTRSFCYCADLIEGIYRLMMSKESLPVNIGNPREMSMLQFAEAVQKAVGSKSKIGFKPLPQDDPKQRKPDITKAKKVLGWEPKVQLEDGIQTTIAYFAEKLATTKKAEEVKKSFPHKLGGWIQDAISLVIIHMSKTPELTLKVGQKAPDFTAQTSGGGSTSLKELKGKYIVLYFYPRDDTPGCTKEACGFRDGYAEFEKAGAVVLGVSPDPVKAHDKFVKKFGLPFTLLADEDKAIAQAYGVWGEKVFMGRKYMGNHRVTFLIGPDGKIKNIWPAVKPEEHAAEVLAAIKG